MAESKLTKNQHAVLSALPDWLGSGLPASVVAELSGVKDAASCLMRLMWNGLAEREKPNEEWPFVYASTSAGRAALQLQGGSEQ